MGLARTIAKNTSFAFITSVIELGIAFITSIMLTRGLGTEQYGLYSYTIWLLGLTALATNLGLGEMSRRFVPEALGRENPSEAVGFVQLSLVFRIIASLMVTVIILFTANFWLQQSGNLSGQIIFILVAISVLPNTIQGALIAILKGFQKFDYSLYMTLAMYPLRLILIIIFMAMGFDILSVLILNIATFCLGIVMGLFFLSRLISLKQLFSRSLLSGKLRNEAIKYSSTVLGMLVLQYLVSQQAEVFFIGLYCSVENVGFYTLANRVGALTRLLPSAFAYVLLPIIAEQFGSGKTETLKKIYTLSSRYLMFISIPIAIGGIALAKPLINVIYGGDYRPVILLFQIILLPIAIAGLTGAGDAVIRGINRPGYLLIANFIFAIINIGLSILLIPKYGIIGATIAGSVPLLLNFPIYTVYISKKLGAGWPVRDTIKIAVSSIIMGLIVYLLQSYLGDVVSLIVCIPLGTVLYIIGIFAFKTLNEEDLNIFGKFENYVPSFLRKYFTAALTFAQKFVSKRSSTGE